MNDPDLSTCLPYLILPVAAWLAWAAFIAARRYLHLRDYRFPPGLLSRLRKQYPQYTPAEWRGVLDGLRVWFRVAQLARGRHVSMPSQAVDVAWHEFILFTREYDAFCRASLGRYLHHVPAEAMRTPTLAQDGIRRAWRLACAIERIDRKQPVRLPRLFRLDAELAFPGGFTYAIDCRAGRDAEAYCASGIGCASGCGGGCGGD